MLLRKTSDIKNRKGNPQEQSGVLKFYQKAKVYIIHIKNKKKPNEKMLSFPEGGRKRYGRRNRIAN